MLQQNWKELAIAKFRYYNIEISIFRDLEISTLHALLGMLTGREQNHKEQKKERQP